MLIIDIIIDIIENTIEDKAIPFIPFEMNKYNDCIHNCGKFCAYTLEMFGVKIKNTECERKVPLIKQYCIYASY